MGFDEQYPLAGEIWFSIYDGMESLARDIQGRRVNEQLRQL